MMVLKQAEIPKKASPLCKLNCFFNYVPRKKLSINGKHNIYQQFTPSVSMHTTKYNPERLIIVPKQDDEVVRPECRLTLEG